MIWCRQCLPRGKARAIVVNSGNANVFTGRAGRQVGRKHRGGRGAAVRLRPRDEVFISSTGVIGEPPPADRISGRAAAQSCRLLRADGWEAAARAIMTTDTFPKGATATGEIGGATVRINGFCQGLGHDRARHGDDAGLTSSPTPRCRRRAAGAAGRGDRPSRSTAITVDGDTSTSDTVLLCATGRREHAADRRAPAIRALADFRRALEAVMLDLAQQIVRDGEGAQKFVTIDVDRRRERPGGAPIGLAIGNSPLVKTAIAGERRQLGPHRHGGRQGRRAGRPRPAVDRVGGIRIAARRRRRCRATTRRPVAEHMKGREIDDRRRYRPRPRQAPRCGPAT